MNRHESDILINLIKEPYDNQKLLSERVQLSIGAVNGALKSLEEKGFIDNNMHPTEAGIRCVKDKSPKRAIILAAGFGMRMVPINLECPKALVTIRGEVLIERTIKQLHEVGIREIYIVVGFLKEQFEYLIDEYGVELVVNPEYYCKNNLHSLSLVADKLDRSYIIPGDVWCAINPFGQYELYSWYMVSNEISADSTVRVNRKNELVSIPKEQPGNAMIGISYLEGDAASCVSERIAKMDNNADYDNSFWEESLITGDRMIVNAKTTDLRSVVEINTYEQLRELDEESDQLKSDAISIIANALCADAKEIVDITVLKKGMTNRSFMFTCRDIRYIMRIPGEGTDKLINRQQEAIVYKTIAGKGVCDELIYINPDNGYKITKFVENARVCDGDNEEDLIKVMKLLKKFHGMSLSVEHDFDILGEMEFYEKLWDGNPSVYRDYAKTKENVIKLGKYIDGLNVSKCLTHIDANPDNFLFGVDENGSETVQLIDWEYAGMQDPHVDIAMFAIYAMYDRTQTDRLIDIYFEGKCPEEVRTKIYAYMAMCGLLWSNWCEYKRNLGVEFGEYSIRQYRYAKEYYKLVCERTQIGELSSCIQ